MDITITNNPYQNNYVLSDGTYRVAKLNNQTKRPNITRYWESNMPEVKTNLQESSKAVEAVSSSNHSYDIVLGRLEMTSEYYEHYCNVNGFRKLKVNSIVRDKTLKAYEGSTKVQPEKPLMIQEEDVNIPTSQNVLSDNSSNDIPTSRISRLEKTAEMPKVTPDLKEVNDYRSVFKENQTQPVEEKISLSRVERRQSLDEYSNNVENHFEKVQVGKEAEALNRIATFSPLSQNAKGEKNELQDAYSRFEVSERKKKNSREEVLKLEKQIREVKGLLEEKNKRAIADLAAKTKANEEEALGYTMHSEDLRAQLEELRRQLDSSEM